MTTTNMPTEPIFSYSAAPQPVKPRTKYRSVGEEAGLTLMSDPRVRRGLTVGGGGGSGTGSAAGARTPGAGAGTAAGKSAEFLPTKSKRSSSKAAGGGGGGHSAPGQPTYTFTVPDFSGSEFNLDQYLVASDDAVKHNNNQHEGCQTDEFAPLPPPAQYVPRKTGVDMSTQVDSQRELFDFDAQVAPMVEVIVRKTLEQALFELSSEDELKTLQYEVTRFNVEREAEASWILLKEKETIEDGKIKEKERAERARVMDKERGVRRTVGAAAAMHQLMPAVQEDLFQDLFRSGVWRNDDREEAAAVLPALAEEARQKTDLYGTAFDMIEELLLRAQEMHAELGQVEHIKRKDVHVHVTLSAKETGGEQSAFLGCFKLSPRSTLASLEADMQAKIAEQKITIFSSLQKPLSTAFGRFAGKAGMTPGLELLTLEVPKEINITI
jgi:hypothetical protein